MESDDFDPEHNVINEDLQYLVPDPGYEEKGGGEEEDHQGCGGLTLSHTCTERYLFSLRTYFYGENPWLHYIETTANQFFAQKSTSSAHKPFFMEKVHGYTLLKLQ